MKILEDNKNNLLNRREIKMIVEAEKNPSFEETSKLFSEKFKANEELIAVKQIGGKFGRNTFLISAFIYDSKEEKEKLEKKKEKKTEGAVK
jgi:ribosomal protein S24E